MARNLLPWLLFTFKPYWSFVYIRKTYIGQSPKPQKVQIWKMRAFSVKCAHFQENACILCKLDENAHIFRKMRAFYAN